MRWGCAEKHVKIADYVKANCVCLFYPTPSRWWGRGGILIDVGKIIV